MLASRASEESILARHGDVVGVPHLVRGRLITVGRGDLVDARAALGEGVYAELGRTQVLRHAGTSAERRSQVLVLPTIDDPAELCCTDHGLMLELTGLSTQAVFEFLRRVGVTLGSDRFQDELAKLALTLDVDSIRATLEEARQLFCAPTLSDALDGELGMLGVAGARLLDDWTPWPATSAGAHPVRVRAFPTRQLHITAGNTPAGPFVSVLRALLLHSPAVVKLASSNVLLGALLGLALFLTDPEHPLVRGFSIVYWRGGDARVEDVLVSSRFFDRVVVWGDAGTQAALKARAADIKVVAFGPRYGVSLVAVEGEGALADVVRAAASDALISGQQSCYASLIHYVAGGEPGAFRYAKALALELSERTAGRAAPAHVAQGLRRAQRGLFASGTWFLNRVDGQPSSGVVVMPGTIDVGSHPMSRLVIVRPIEVLTDALRWLHRGVSAVGVWPEGERHALRDAIALRGVDAVLPLGAVGGLLPHGLPREGARISTELVSWVVG